MNHTPLTILGAGEFDSRRRFPNHTVTTPRRVHTYELEYFFEDGGISVLNGKEYPIQSANILLAKPNDRRYSHLPFRCQFIHFNVEDPQLIAALDTLPSVLTLADPQKNHALFKKIAAAFFSPEFFDHLYAQALLITLLHRIITLAKEEGSLITKAQRYIELNYQEALTVQTIAEHCNVSASYLHKLFKSTLDITPGEYLINCRLSTARDLLINTSLSLNEIAFSCGFNSQSYFSDCFKKRIGVSPKNFRKNAAYQL